MLPSVESLELLFGVLPKLVFTGVEGAVAVGNEKRFDVVGRETDFIGSFVGDAKTVISAGAAPQLYM